MAIGRTLVPFWNLPALPSKLTKGISATNPPPRAGFILLSGDGQVDGGSGVYTAPNYHFQLQNKKLLGSLDETTGIFTASAQGEVTVRAIDAEGTIALANIQIEPPWLLF